MYSLLTSKTTDNIKCVISEEETTAYETEQLHSYTEIMVKVAGFNVEMTELKTEVAGLKAEVAELKSDIIDDHNCAFNRVYKKHSAMTKASNVLEMSMHIVGCGLMFLGSAHGFMAFMKWSDRRLNK